MCVNVYESDKCLCEGKHNTNVRGEKTEMVSKEKLCTKAFKKKGHEERDGKQSLHPQNAERFIDVVETESFC